MQKSKSGQSKRLKQVGYFAHCEDAFDLGIVTHNWQQTVCTMCGGSRCMHTKVVQDPGDPDIHHNRRHVHHGMGEDAFEAMCTRMLNDDRSALKLHFVSYKAIPWREQDFSPALSKSRFSRCTGRPPSEWTACDQDGNLILCDSVDDDSGYSDPYYVTRDTFLLCSNGVY